MAKFHTLAIADIRRETTDCVSIAFDIPADLRSDYAFKPGQNLTLRTTINGEELRRSYSICSIPGESQVRVAIKKVPHGKFSHFANEHLKKGALLDVMTPTGSFVVKSDPGHRKHYVAFAAGSGITPVFSMLHTILLTEPLSRFTLFYGNRTTASIIFREAIEALKNRFMDRFNIYHILSREKSDAQLFNGRIDTEKCLSFTEKLIDAIEVDEYLLCGPEAMITAVKACLLQKGVPEKHIHFELFQTPTAGMATPLPVGNGSSGKPGDDHSTLHLKVDGMSVDFDMPRSGQSILDAALQHGVDLPFACKGGICTTCKARLIEGQVRMDVHYGLEQEEIDQGYVLTCQSHPLTELVSVDFDQAV